MNIFRKLIWNGHTTSQTERTDQGQITQKLKKQNSKSFILAFDKLIQTVKFH